MRNTRFDMRRANGYEALLYIETCHTLLCGERNLIVALLFGNHQQMQQQCRAHTLAPVFE